jgi:undecaprenyl diphosphate synthase
MDGNGRWAKKRGLPRLLGHRAGLRRLEEMVRLLKKQGIRYFSAYAFSTENWSRPQMEVDGLMSLFRHYIRRRVSALKEEGGRLRFCGRRDRFPPDLLEMMRWAEEETRSQTTIDFILCVDYGGRAEILDAVSALVASGHRGEVTEADLKKFFYLPDVPDPDLIVRTSGELRVSNFWLWESAYSEFYFTDACWPDFGEPELIRALNDYAARDRRYGGRP